MSRKSTRRKSTGRKSTRRKSTGRKSTGRKSTGRKSTRRSSTRRKSTRRKSRVRIPIKKKGALEGYHVDDPLKVKRRVLDHYVNKDGYSTVIKRLNVLAIYNKNRNPSMSEKVKRDIKSIQKKYGRNVYKKR